MPALITACAEAGYRQMVAYIDAASAPSLHLHEAFGFERAGLLKGVGFEVRTLDRQRPDATGTWPGQTTPPADYRAASISTDPL